MTIERTSKLEITQEWEVILTPRPGLSEKEAIKRLEDLGNPILDYDHRGAVVMQEGGKFLGQAPELRWACDFCGAYSVSREKVEHHEATCERKPNG